MRKSVVVGVAVLTVLAAARGYAADDSDQGHQDNCISISHIQRTEVVDERTILFYMTGGQIKKMTLAFRCPSLTFYKSFGYRTHATRLCARIDEIVARGGSHCPIGDISAISVDDAASLKSMTRGQ